MGVVVWHYGFSFKIQLEFSVFGVVGTKISAFWSEVELLVVVHVHWIRKLDCEC